MRVLTGVFSPGEKDYSIQSDNIFVFEDSNYSVSVIGEAIINNEKNSFELITENYSKYGNGITELIKGLYILVVYDKKKNSLSVFQDRTTSPLTLYYTYNNDVLYFSTSLKKLLLNSKIERKLNEKVIEEFILNGFIYGKQTLIQGVYKIKSFYCLNADSTGVVQNKVKYSFAGYTKEKSIENFKEVLDKAIVEQASNEQEINAPLSSGYDSSYIVDVLSKQTKLPINAFSIGGKFGKNELPVVKQNIKYFDRAKLISEITDSSTLQNYPDIVWRLDGNVYEVGLFLQYELNQLVNKNGKKTLICGECADQVMNQYYFSDERNSPDNTESDRYYEFSEYPYVFGSYLILKKNGILANSFDIITKYPYLNNEFVSLCVPLAQYNGKKKKIHTENCNKFLPKEIIENISKIGGATECHSLFNDEKEIKRFFRYVEKSEFYKKHQALIKKHSYEEKVKPDFITAVKTKVRNALYTISRNTDKPDNYFNEEIKLKEYLSYTFLILFDEMFISGKYDKEFSSQCVDYKLDDFM